MEAYQSEEFDYDAYLKSILDGTEAYASPEDVQEAIELADSGSTKGE